MPNEPVTHHFIDKTGWGDGPWQEEPDYVFWIDEATSLPCVICRTPGIGHLCGYVGVPPGNRAFGKGYDDVNLCAHGGLTYAEDHAPIPDGGPENLPTKGLHHWWLGFDCAHAGDLCPPVASKMSMVKLGYGRNESYRTLEYVKEEVGRLCKQIYGLMSPLELLARCADGVEGPEEPPIMSPEEAWDELRD